jgi:LacI family transcriptional regulator
MAGAGLTPSRARIKDVAALAGVSVATASRALADDPKVASGTKAKVLDSARTLRFRPNSIARDLRSGGVTTAIGYVIGDLVNPWYSQVAAGAEEVFRKAGLELIVATTESDPEREPLVVKTMLERRVQALLIVPLSDNHSYLEGERQLGTPLIFVDRPPVNLTADSIVLDNQGGMQVAVDSLISNGHKRIALLGGQESLWTTQQRIEGYRSALRKAGIAFNPDLVVYSSSALSDLDKTISSLTSLADPPTALVTTHNRLTVGLLQTHQELLGNMALIGFDDFELANLLNISVIAHDPQQLGRSAAEITLNRIKNPLGVPQSVVIPTKLIPRGSGEKPNRSKAK